MYAAEEGSVDTLRYLLESDANIERKDAEGYTALLHAVKNGNRQCILLLLQKGMYQYLSLIFSIYKVGFPVYLSSSNLLI